MKGPSRFDLSLPISNKESKVHLFAYSKSNKSVFEDVDTEILETRKKITETAFAAAAAVACVGFDLSCTQCSIGRGKEV